jgi:hypothetical protein
MITKDYCDSMKKLALLCKHYCKAWERHKKKLIDVRNEQCKMEMICCGLSLAKIYRIVQSAWRAM